MIPEGFVDPAWQANIDEMERLLLVDGELRPDYLEIAGRFFGTNGLDPTFVAERVEWCPIRTDDPVLIVHAAALSELADEMGLDFRPLKRILVWGGGFGSQLLVLSKFTDAELIAVDLPICLRVQERYCADHGIKATFVQLEDINEVKPVDLFVATHSLSECPVKLQEQVVGMNFFGARYLMLAYGENPSFSDEVNGHFDILFNDLWSTYPSAQTSLAWGERQGERMFDRG